jgi:hypothetical protein
MTPSEYCVDQGYTSSSQRVEQANAGTQMVGPVAEDTSWQQAAATEGLWNLGL